MTAAQPATQPHVPVMRDPFVDALAPAPGKRVVDGTFGAGGHSRVLLARGATVIALDRDPDAIAAGQALVAEADGALTLIHERFSRMDAVVDGAVDGVGLDIGVSSMQIDQAPRGFSFQADGPLDMRMDQAGPSAADFVNEADEGLIADILYRYGEEPRARRIARAIVAARPIARTGELAAVVRRAVGHRPGEKKDPATRAFQAIRIHINRELGELEDGLAAAERVLKPGGRLAVITFHSLEDRMVKSFLRIRSGATPAGSRHLPAAPVGRAPTFDAVAKPVRPSAAELEANPRARSATLRVASRTAAPAWPFAGDA
ncbi:16S rRNA (cytosine(1402)-N(4))-methyltransferase RsmH [Sphingomonas flavalba]|uniref:16S rRNA (cytosine(1402)-N(4))-methyltransferase RsmH n=1 Tax=Sphingomonas flavalba TaxID=2559804 RepID=UPI0039E1F3C4